MLRIFFLQLGEGFLNIGYFQVFYARLLFGSLVYIDQSDYLVPVLICYRIRHRQTW